MSGSRLSSLTRQNADCFNPLFSVGYSHDYYYHEVRELVIPQGVEHVDSGWYLQGWPLLPPEDILSALKPLSFTGLTTDDRYTPLVSTDFSHSFQCQEVRELLLVEGLEHAMFYSNWVLRDGPFLPPEQIHALCSTQSAKLLFRVAPLADVKVVRLKKDIHTFMVFSSGTDAEIIDAVMMLLIWSADGLSLAAILNYKSIDEYKLTVTERAVISVAILHRDSNLHITQELLNRSTTEANIKLKASVPFDPF